MMTPDKIQKFVAAAKAGGHKDEEIAQFIAQQSRAEAASTTPQVEEPKKGFLQGVGEIFNKGLTQVVGMSAGAPKLGRQAADKDKLIRERGEKMRQLAIRARNETDPVEKEALLAESRRLSSEVEQAGAEIGAATEGFQKKFDITEKDVKGNDAEFIAKRTGKAMIDTGIMLAPVGKIFKTAAGAGKAAKIAAGAANTAVTGATISALDEATTLEDITPEERLDRAISAGLWGAAAGGILGAGGEAFKLLKQKFFGDKKVKQQIAMMFAPDTGEKLRFENSFGTSFEDEFTGRDLSELASRKGKGELDYKDLKDYFSKKLKDYIAQKKTLLTELTNKTGGASKDEVVANLRKVVAGWAETNDLSTEEIDKLQSLIEKIDKGPAVVPWEKVDNWRSQLGDMGEAAYKTMGAKDSIFANAEVAMRNMVEEAGKQIGNIKALNKGISYYKLAEDSIASKGANELKKVANDMFQFVTQTLPIMAAGGSIGALAGGEDNRGAGAVVGTAAGTLGAVALGKSIRLNMATPEGRIKMANWITKNAEKLQKTPGLIKELLTNIAKNAAIRTPGEVMTAPPAPTEPTTPAPTTAPGQEDVTAGAGTEQMYDVKDNQTGKIVQVPASKLKDFGITIPSTEETQGVGMSVDQLAQKVIEAAAAGDSKAVTRWSAALDAAKKAGPAAEKKTEAQRSADAATSIAKSAFADIQAGGIKTGPLALLEEGKASLGTEGYGDPTTIKFNAKISSLKAMIAKARAGTSFTADEERLLNRYTPTVGDTTQKLKIKLEMLANPEDPDLMSALTKVAQFNTTNQGVQ